MDRSTGISCVAGVEELMRLTTPDRRTRRKLAWGAGTSAPSEHGPRRSGLAARRKSRPAGQYRTEALSPLPHLPPDQR